MRKLHHRFGGTALLISLALATGTADAGIKCWKNSEGVRECGSQVPPEYVQKGYTEVNEAGTVSRHRRAKTEAEIAEERRQRKLAEERAREEAEKAAEKARRVEERAARDRVLLRTFSSEDEIREARRSKLQALESRIELAQGRLDKLRANLLQLEERAASQELTGRGVAPRLHKDIVRVDGQIAEHRRFIAARRKDAEAVKTRFSADLKRYQELMIERAKQAATRP